jgi:hypothetical protein
MPRDDLFIPPLAYPLPDYYTISGGADTGTFASGCIIATCDDPMEVLVLAEFPNYRYVSGEIEELNISVSEWCDWYGHVWALLNPFQSPRAWADANTQFKAEYKRYGVKLMANRKPLDVRTEITRTYVNAKPEDQVVWLAPWLEILPYELERARWPPADDSAGKFMRIKKHDHTLDSFEHPLSRRPRGRKVQRKKKKTFLERMHDQYARVDRIRSDRHLGVN